MRKGWEPKSEKSSRALAFCKETPPRQGCRDNRTQIENSCQRRRSTGVWQTWNFPSLSLICSCRKAAVYSCQIQAPDKPRGNQGVLNSYKLGAFSFLFFFFLEGGCIVLIFELRELWGGQIVHPGLPSNSLGGTPAQELCSGQVEAGHRVGPWVPSLSSGIPCPWTHSLYSPTRLMQEPCYAVRVWGSLLPCSTGWLPSC